jgi:hypothetical protein
MVMARNTSVEAPPPPAVRIAGLVMRTLFLLVLAVITARVSSPQVEHFRSLYETPDDLIRVMLGFAVCVWLVANIFILPRDTAGYRTWFYLGFLILPLSILCAYVIW